MDMAKQLNKLINNVVCSKSRNFHFILLKFFFPGTKRKEKKKGTGILVPNLAMEIGKTWRSLGWTEHGFS